MTALFNHAESSNGVSFHIQNDLKSINQEFQIDDYVYRIMADNVFLKH